jgi:hypothetical protein
MSGTPSSCLGPRPAQTYAARRPYVRYGPQIDESDKTAERACGRLEMPLTGDLYRNRWTDRPGICRR